MEKKRLKESNRSFLKRVFSVKSRFYPVINYMSGMRNYRLAERILDPVVKLSGIDKSVHFFFKYRDFASWFRDRFRPGHGDSGAILFPMMAGANSNFTLLNLLFAEYFLKRDGLKPLFYTCDSAFEICTRDGMLKSREHFSWFCHECYGGFDHIEERTGVATLRMSRFLEESEVLLEREYERIALLDTGRECEEYMFEGLRIGLMARKSVLRYFLVGRLIFSDRVKDIYHRFLRSGVRYAVAFAAMLDRNREVKYAIINNGSLLFEALARELCRSRGIDYMTYETYIGNNSIVYKRNGPVMEFNWEEEYRVFLKGYNPDEEAALRVSRFFEGLRSGVEMYAVLNREHLFGERVEGKRYACLFTNLNFDTAVIDRNFLFTDMEDWIYSVIEFWKRERPGIVLIIRVHPGELKLRTATREFLGDRIRMAAGESEEDIIVVDSDEKVNSYELIAGMEFGLIYSSTIGLEIAWDGKPCLVAGMPWFRERGFIVYPSSRESYFDELGRFCRAEREFTPSRDEIISTVDFVFFNRVKRFSKINFYTPKEEPATRLEDPAEMIACNIGFFASFREELMGGEE